MESRDPGTDGLRMGSGPRAGGPTPDAVGDGSMSSPGRRPSLASAHLGDAEARAGDAGLPISWLGRRAVWVVLLVVVCALTLFANLGGKDLWGADESHDAERAREMLASRQWLRPTFLGQADSDKPPLQHWLMAGAGMLFGPSDTVFRLPAAGFGLLAGAIFAGHRALERERGWRGWCSRRWCSGGAEAWRVDGDGWPGSPARPGCWPPPCMSPWVPSSRDDSCSSITCAGSLSLRMSWAGIISSTSACRRSWANGSPGRSSCRPWSWRWRLPRAPCGAGVCPCPGSRSRSCSSPSPPTSGSRICSHCSPLGLAVWGRRRGSSLRARGRAAPALVADWCRGAGRHRRRGRATAPGDLADPARPHSMGGMAARAGGG